MARLLAECEWEGGVRRGPGEEPVLQGTQKVTVARAPGQHICLTAAQRSRTGTGAEAPSCSVRCRSSDQARRSVVVSPLRRARRQR